jgi:hypothetical protein
MGVFVHTGLSALSCEHVSGRPANRPPDDWTEDVPGPEHGAIARGPEAEADVIARRHVAAANPDLVELREAHAEAEHQRHVVGVGNERRPHLEEYGASVVARRGLVRARLAREGEHEDGGRDARFQEPTRPFRRWV